MNKQVARVPIKTEWMNARTKSEWDTAEAVGQRILAAQSGDRATRLALARLLSARGRADEAIPHWKALRADDPKDFEAAYHVAASSVREGLTASQASVETAGAMSGNFQQHLLQALMHPLPKAGNDFKHVAICGVSYCGSTLLDRILGGLPGAASIGESHWLTKERVGKEYKTFAVDESLSEVQFVPCTVCGRNCSVLTPEFRMCLLADHTDWYSKIARQLGVSTLISADKNAPKLVDHDPLLRLSAVVVFKSPEQAWRSKLNKFPGDKPASFYEDECRAYVEVWTRSYLGFLDQFKPQGPVVFLSFEEFTRTPEPILRAVCERLDLSYDPSVLSKTQPGHAIGGNSGSMARLRANNYAVDIVELEDPALDPTHAAILAEHAAAQQVHDRLRQRHDAMMDRFSTAAPTEIHAV